MFELLKGSKQDAIAIIKSDHDKVKALFEQFEAADNLRDKKKIAAEAIMELKIHAEIEEKIFYPAVWDDVEEDLMYEADEEHHVAKLLIAELDLMTGSEDHWEAKFTVLAENIRHHIKEEENEMLPQARKAEVDFDALGSKLLVMKEKLKKNGVPPSDEEKLMARSKAKSGKLADSPAKNAKKSTKKTTKSKTATRKPAKSSAVRAKPKATPKRTAVSAAKPRKTAKRQ